MSSPPRKGSCSRCKETSFEGVNFETVSETPSRELSAFCISVWCAEPRLPTLP